MLQCCTDSASKDTSNKDSYRESALEINLPNGKTTHTYVRVLLLFISDFAPLYLQKKAIDRSHQNILHLLHYPVYILMRQSNIFSLLLSPALRKARVVQKGKTCNCCLYFLTTQPILGSAISNLSSSVWILVEKHLLMTLRFNLRSSTCHLSQHGFCYSRVPITIL